ncbi:MAG TPA: ATP-binding protein, partial [Tepidisphaeraceae bacterium]
MTEHGESLYRFTRPRLAQSLLVAAALVALMAVLRLWWMPEHVLPVAFGLPLLVCIWMRDVRILWGMAAAFFAISAIKFGWLMPQSSADAGIVYRCIGLGMVLLDILAVSGIVHWLIRLRESLEEKNAELLGHNEQVTERDEEISHQNEELQTQAEELEQQSEELRVTNEELLRREHWLAALLKLSRTLTVKLSRQETLERICQTLAELGNGPIHAAAILERRGDAMHLVCSSGFEPAAEMTIRYASSFGALVLEKDRLGYLEDVSQRPDLVLPGRKGGAAFRSVLAAPLRVAGEAVGTIEVYGTQVQQWQAEQVQLLESLASQASISLEAEKLFEEVERERIRFEGIFNTLPIGAAIIDCGSSALRINPAGAALLRVPADFDFFGADAPHWRNYRDGVESPIADAPIKRALRGELVVNQELEFEFADQRVTLLCSAAPIRDRDGNIVSAVCGFADITSQKNLQRELENRRRAAEESSARKTRFLAAASHDIRTPANAINLLAELIKRGAQNPDLATDIPELTADLQSSATALVELVSDVLDLTRFDSGNVELSLSEFNLGTAIVEECRQLMPVALEKKIRLEIVPPAPPMRVRADRIKLLRIILNLVTNAIKYTDDGFVRVTASAGEDGRVRIAVADSGMGIDGQHIERIFDEFFQLSSAEPNRSKGMGLGLAICKR